MLTNDHLNEMFDYLDVQERLTRNKLIGIGIVCGLDIDNKGTTINISKGCGVTSKGYLIVWGDENQLQDLTQYIAYTLPATPAYTPFLNPVTGKQYELLRMISDKEADTIDGVKNPVGPVLKDKIVVLFLEALERDLKNCDTQDCNEKGRQMEFNVRPLLVSKTDMEAIISNQKKLSGEEGLSNSYIERLGLKDIQLKRFDVKATPLQDAFDIYDAYLACFNNDVIKNIAEVYSQCYSIFQPVLKDYGGTNPFENLQPDLKKKLDNIKATMPLYIQYYYDFLDDLIKAYNEFRERSFEVITECCPDEDLFPMHLMLGEATVDTVDYVRSPFRQYFISSPLFNQQANLLNEVKVLFDRMVSLVKSLFIPTFNLRTGVPIRITPSTWGNTPLSSRSIPFYYNLGGVYKSWNALKTRKGKTTYNLTYNADKYTPQPPEHILTPLLYAIEPYDFYRIEGHIGQPYTSVLNVILSIRNSNRLPFDVIALKAGADATDTAIKYDCHFEDIETQFTLLRAELACKMHEPLCIAAKVPSILRFNPGNDNIKFNFLSTINVVHSSALQDIVNNKNLINTSFVQAIRFSRKGDFLKTYCPVVKATLGSEYTDSLNKFFPRPAQIDLGTVSGSRAALLHLVDITEALMQTMTGASTIYNFKYDNFKRIYDSMISFFTEFMQALLNADDEKRALNPLMYGNLEAVVNGCIDEKIKALTLEYTKRVEKIQKQNLLSEYLNSNPGIDHKAGVPRGGTFIIVYHDAPANTTTPAIAANALTNISNAEILAVDTEKPITKLADTSAITKANLSQILKIFDTSALKLSATQAATLKSLTLQQFTTASAKLPFNIPDNAVVADFYLPYLCCSDCPPVTYVLPKVQQDILLLSLEKTDFCNNDEKTYKVTVNPLGGTLTASAGGIDADKLEFKPKGLGAGINKLTYTLPDDRSINVDVKITAAFEINFDFSTSPDNPLVVKFIPVNTANKTVLWNFGDNTATSAEQSPTHNFVITGDTQTFKVTLTATDGPCVITRQQELIITKPKPQIFTIKPSVFCSNDESLHAFIADPAIPHFTDIENPNELRMDKDGSGNIVFVPAGQGIQVTKNYHLFYKGVAVELIIVAAFQVEFKAEPIATDPLSRRFVASNIDNRNVTWNFGDGTPVSTEKSPVHTYQFSDSEKVFLVILTVTDGPCNATVEQNVLVLRPIPNSFAIEPVAFCSRDRQRKIFNIQPKPTDIAEIKNGNSLNIERDAASGDVFFIPAKQDLSQSKNFVLSYRGIDLSLSIFVPNAGFIMDIRHNPSPVAVFPTLLTLIAKEEDADSYVWTLSNNVGQKFEFKERVVKDFNMAQLNNPNRSPVPLNILLQVNNNKRTGVACEDKKDYIITGDVLGNHINKGDFDNLAPF